MARPFYSQAHYRRLSNGSPDTHEHVAERVHYRAVGVKAHEEMLAKFAPLTEANAVEALAWQTTRIKELMEAWVRDGRRNAGITEG